MVSVFVTAFGPEVVGKLGHQVAGERVAVSLCGGCAQYGRRRCLRFGIFIQFLNFRSFWSGASNTAAPLEYGTAAAITYATTSGSGIVGACASSGAAFGAEASAACASLA